MNIFEQVPTLITLLLTLCILIYTIYKSRTNYIETIVQQAITDVGEQIGENIEEIFASPNVKRAMSILGKESGVVRAEQATVDKFNRNIGDVIPSLNIIGEKLGMDATEMISLLNDPIVGPYINKFLGGILGQPLNSPRNTQGREAGVM